MEASEKVGVIVGRFQVPELTEGHRELLEYVLNKKHQLTILVLGVAAVPFTRENPLEFTARKAMIDAEYPGAFTIVPLADVRDDDVWSERLDALVQAVAGEKPVVLYGSRDSFVKHYTGRYAVDEFKQHVCCSGTEERQKAGHMHGTSSDFRQGCVYATQGQYPTSYQTVDVCVFVGQADVLLGRKKTDPQGRWRLFGGFVDPKDASLEEAARRELHEETGLQLSSVRYVCSSRVDDWRYRGLQDGIMTALFAAQADDSVPYAPGDDIAEVKRFTISAIDKDRDIVPEHRKLLDAACRYMQALRKEETSGPNFRPYKVHASYNINDLANSTTTIVGAWNKTAAIQRVALDIERKGGTEISCSAELMED